MSEVVLEHAQGYEIGWASAHVRVAAELIVPLFQGAQDVRRSGVVGPNGIVRSDVPGIGPVVVKHYLRGGVLQRLIQRSYIRWGACRSCREFEMLQAVRALGVSAPEPILYASQGKFLYRAWLVMREIEQAESLASVSMRDESQAVALIAPLVNHLSILIQNRIFHLDLHPGNVVIGSGQSIHILDFDKAKYHEGGLNQLRDSYLRRWRRAVIKHNLPESLSEAFCSRLRKNFETWNQPARSQS